MRLLNVGSEVMFFKMKKLLAISAILFLFAACAGIEPMNQDASVEQTDVTLISELQNTENFQRDALEHILEGELNKKGHAVGFHYDKLPTKKGEIIKGTKTVPNELGVYEAKVVVSGVEKTSNRGYSTFFPDNWDTQEVVDAINNAYENKVFISGNTYEGLTSDGMIIRMYLNQEDKIISAFPIYE